MAVSVMARKQRALDDFLSRLLSTKTRKLIGKVILFGSMNENKASRDSDIDLLVLAVDKLEEVSDRCAEASMWTSIEMKESIEPLIYCLDEVRYTNSYFLYQVLKKGREVYKMEEEELAKAEAKNYLNLAKEYLELANNNLENGFIRGSIDAAYNSAELCAKGLLLLKMSEIPGSHGGTIGKFGELYVKSGLISEEVGRNLNKSLQLRNKARYDYHTEFSIEKAKGVIKLSEDIASFLEGWIEKE
jgi:uncharacterized protein (UPF0332 family)/predicted nucleotidyltransferase